MDKEVGLLKDEKYETEKEIDGLGIPLGVISECISMRDNRQGAELTYDEGDTELKKVFAYRVIRSPSLESWKLQKI